MYNDDDEIWDNLMESLFDDEDYLEEGLFDKFKEKRAEKKAEKAEKRAQKIMGKGVVISEKEFLKFKKEFDNTVKFVVSLLKKEVPGATFINTDVNKATHRVNKIKNGVEEHIYSLKIFQMDDDNYDKYKSKSKYKELRDSENAWDYVDELLQDNCTRIADPIEAKGFENIYNDNSVMSKKKDGKRYLEIILGDEATFDIDVYMEIIVQKESIEESYDFDIEDYLEEGLFDKFKEKRAEKKARKEYDGNKVRSEIRKIWQDVQRIMKSNPNIKPFNDNGLSMHSLNDIYDLSDKDAGVYETGVDEFLLVYVDLWDYKGGNPRQIMADSADGWHPVNHAEEKLRKLIEELLEKKYPDFKVLPYGGDWDTGDITIGLK